jgi:hypothetical protein
VLTSPSLIVAMICLGAVWLHASRTDDLEITQRYQYGANCIRQIFFQKCACFVARNSRTR